MTINTTIVEASLQEKLDATTVSTESTDFLVLSKSMEALVGVITVGEVQEEGATQIAAIQAIAANLSNTTVAEVRTASIDMNDNLFISPELRNQSETVKVMVADDVDYSLGSVQTKTVSADTTFTFSNPPASGKASKFVLVLDLSNTPTVTWPATVKWDTGTPPTLSAAGTDIYNFMTIDGGVVWFGFTSGKAMS